MTNLENLINFWTHMLQFNRWSMEVTVQNIVEQTITALEELKNRRGE